MRSNLRRHKNVLLGACLSYLTMAIFVAVYTGSLLAPSLAFIGANAMTTLIFALETN